MSLVVHLPAFLEEHEVEILALTEARTRELAGAHPTSDVLQRGLPIFYRQMIEVIRHAEGPAAPAEKDVDAIAKAADRGDEPAMAEAAGKPDEAELARSAGRHGQEMLRLGYTLSHVVHAYGAMCQSITELAAKKEAQIAAADFRAFNLCLDVAIAAAVTDFQAQRDVHAPIVGAPTLLAREVRNALVSATVAFEAIQQGTVGVRGSTAESLAGSLKRIEALIDRAGGVGWGRDVEEAPPVPPARGA